MLYPQTNAARMVLDLGGVWDFKLSGDEEWQSIAVPASYNDQKADPRFRAHCGTAIYRTRFTVPALMARQRRVLRFDAVTHDARVFLNGAPLCEHRGGFLPFEAEITGLVSPGETAELVIETDNRISHATLPVGNEGGTAFLAPTIRAFRASRRASDIRGRSICPISTSLITRASRAPFASIRRRSALLKA